MQGGGKGVVANPTLRPSGLEPDRQKSVEGPVTQAERFVDLGCTRVLPDAPDAPRILQDVILLSLPPGPAAAQAQNRCEREVMGGLGESVRQQNRCK